MSGFQLAQIPSHASGSLTFCSRFDRDLIPGFFFFAYGLWGGLLWRFEESLWLGPHAVGTITRDMPAIAISALRIFDESFWPGRMPVCHVLYSFYGLLAFDHITKNIPAGIPRILFSCQNDVRFHQRAWGHGGSSLVLPGCTQVLSPWWRSWPFMQWICLVFLSPDSLFPLL